VEGEVGEKRGVRWRRERGEKKANLEVVAERPVTEHLEESVVVRVLSDVVEVCFAQSA
jgi:hypothetical protein